MPSVRGLLECWRELTETESSIRESSARNAFRERTRSRRSENCLLVAWEAVHNCTSHSRTNLEENSLKVEIESITPN